jgi:hypothetical protein
MVIRDLYSQYARHANSGKAAAQRSIQVNMKVRAWQDSD